MDFSDFVTPLGEQLQGAARGVAQQAVSSAIGQGQAAANAVVGSALARAQAQLAQTSRTTIVNAVVAALFVAAIIGGFKLAWEHANAR